MPLPEQIALPTATSLEYAFLREVSLILNNQEEINQAVCDHIRKQKLVKKKIVKIDRHGSEEISYSPIDLADAPTLYNALLTAAENIQYHHQETSSQQDITIESLSDSKRRINYQVTLPISIKDTLGKFLAEEKIQQMGNIRDKIILEAIFCEAKTRIENRFNINQTEKNLELKNFAKNACSKLKNVGIEVRPTPHATTAMQESLRTYLNAQEYKLLALVARIKDIEADYKKIGHRKHIKDIKMLIKNMNDVTKNDALNDEQKYHAILNVVKNAFEKEQGRFCRPSGLRSLFQKKRTEDEFIKRMNGNRNDHHYTRLLGLCLQTEAIKDPTQFKNDTDLSEMVKKIWIGSNPIYRKHVPHASNSTKYTIMGEVPAAPSTNPSTTHKSK